MKDFLGKYSYGIVKMFVTQFVISLFGALLAMATASSGNDTLTLAVGCFAMLFYLFLIYDMMWEIGAKDKISVDVGKKEYRPFTGLWMALIASIPSIIIAILYTIAYPLMSSARWAGTLAAILNVISLFIHGMYRAITSTVQIAGTYMNNLWWTYFVVIIPVALVAFLAYYLGHKNFKFTALFTRKDGNTEK